MRFFHKWSIIVFFLSMFQIMSACDSGSPKQPETTGRKGAIQFQIHWPDSAEINPRLSKDSFDCDANGVSTIHIKVLSETGQELKKSGPYDCDKGQATLEEVPTGSNRTVVVLAKNVTDEILYRGETTNVQVSESKPKTIDVKLNKFVPELSLPLDRQLVSKKCEILFKWSPVDGAQKYQLQIDEADTFKENSVRTFFTQGNEFSSADNELELDNEINYFWRVQAIDANNDKSKISDKAEFIVNNVSQVTNYTAADSSYPYGLHASDNRLLFIARHSTADYPFNFELFEIAGTHNPAKMVKDIHPNQLSPNAPNIPAPFDLAEMGRWIYFCADEDIWRTDGTEANTQRLDIKKNRHELRNPAQLTVFKNKLYFTANGKDVGRELWVTDGTTDGIQIVDDIRQGRDSSHPSELTVVGEDSSHPSEPTEKEESKWLYFVANDGVHGREVWRFDGIENTLPSLLGDICTGSESNHPKDLVAAKGRLFFSAGDGQNGIEAWMFDPGMDAPEMVPEIYTDPNRGSSPFFLTYINGTRVAYSAYNLKYGRRAYIYDWQASGAPPKPILNNNESLKNSANFITLGDKLYFTATDAGGVEQLWMFDLAAPDASAKAISNGQQIQEARDFTVYGQKLYFSAVHDTMGRELFVADGEKIDMVADIYENQPGSAPANLTVFDGRLYFTAFNGDAGEELYQFCQ